METKEKKKQAKLRVTCDTCGFPKSDVKGTSLTSWIFGKSCQCAVEVDRDAENQDHNDLTSTQELTDINERYETLSILGSGGMGTVYRVRDKTLDKIFALKVLRPELADDREAVVRFKQEISAAQNLSHPNLVSVYDWGLSTEGSPYFVMDYVEGRSLADIIKSEKNLGLQRCLDLLLQVSDALAHAHEHNIVHRDLKPSNILISTSDDGTEFVKVVDFGIAKILPPPGKDTVSLTKTAEIFGSPAYMSPEQCKGERIGKRSDIYSFGCVMFECLIGQPPFARENPVKTILAHIYDQPPSVRSKLVGYSAPDSVAAVVNHCLNKDPEDRYVSVAELIKDLNLLREGQPPVALTRVSKEKRRRQLKFLGFKYSPQILTLLSIVILALAVMDLPWLLALADLQGPKGLHSKHSRAELAMQLVNRANDYNKPYALLMGAEADLESGLLDKARDKGETALAIFKARKDLPDTLIVYRVLLVQSLREGDLGRARRLAGEVTNLQFANLNAAPKKGMRLIGWFYLPTLPAKLLECQLINSQLLFSYGDEDGALASLDEAIDALRKSNPKNVDEQIRFINIRKISLLYKSDKSDEATRLLDKLIADVDAAPSISSDEFYDIGTELLNQNNVSKAKTIFEKMPASEPFLNSKRELALALCFSLEGNPKTVDQYDRAARALITNYYYATRDATAALQLAGAGADLRGPHYIDVYFNELISACARSQSREAPDIFDGNRSSATQRLDTLNSAQINLLINYSNALSLYGRALDADRARMKALKLIPMENSDKRLWQQLGDGMVLDKNFAKAQNLFNFRFDPKLEGSQPTHTADMLDTACADALAGKIGLAKDTLVKITKSYDLTSTNDRAKAYTALGNIALKELDPESAAKYFELSMSELRTPMSGDGDLNIYNRIRLAGIKEKEGKITEALALYNNGILRANSPFLQQCALRRYSELLIRSGNQGRVKLMQDRADKIRRLSTTSDTITQAVEDLTLRVQLNDFIYDPLLAPTIKKN